MAKPMNLDALQEALNNDGKISPEEHAYLITQGIPDRLLEALEDGALDEKEIKDLRAMGFSQKALEALQNAHISEEEKRWLKADLAETMRKWREAQLKNLFKHFDHILKNA